MSDPYKRAAFTGIKRLREEHEQNMRQYGPQGPLSKEQRKQLNRSIKEARRKFDRFPFQSEIRYYGSKLLHFDVINLVCWAALLYVLRYHAATIRHWLDTSSVPWLIGQLLFVFGLASGPGLFLFFVWRAMREKDSFHRGNWIKAAVVWGLMLLGIVVSPYLHHFLGKYGISWHDSF